MSDGFDWANVALTIANAGLTAFTAWVGYKVWRSSVDADLPALEYNFYPNEDGGKLHLTARNRSDARWVIDRIKVVEPEAVHFRISVMAAPENAWTAPELASTHPEQEVNIGQELGPRGADGPYLIAGSDKAHHSFDLAIPSALKDGAPIKLVVSFYSREARTRRHTETITIRLKRDKQTVPA